MSYCRSAFLWRIYRDNIGKLCLVTLKRIPTQNRVREKSSAARCQPFRHSSGLNLKGKYFFSSRWSSTKFLQLWSAHNPPKARPRSDRSERRKPWKCLFFLFSNVLLMKMLRVVPRPRRMTKRWFAEFTLRRFICLAVGSSHFILNDYHIFMPFFARQALDADCMLDCCCLFPPLLWTAAAHFMISQAEIWFFFIFSLYELANKTLEWVEHCTHAFPARRGSDLARAPEELRADWKMTKLEFHGAFCHGVRSKWCEKLNSSKLLLPAKMMCQIPPWRSSWAQGKSTC